MMGQTQGILFKINKKFAILRRDAIAKEFVIFASSSVVMQGSRFIANLWAAKQLSPPTMGIWNALSLILTYTPFITLGVLSGLGRDIPFYRGEGNNKNIVLAQSSALSIAISIAVCVALCVTLFTLAFISDSLLRTSLLFLAMGIVAQMFFQYLQIYLRSDLLFGLISKQQVLFGGMVFLIVIPLLLLWGLPGFILGQILTLLIVSAFVLTTGKITLRFGFDLDISKRLIKIGAPIMIAGLLFGLLTTIDRWLILYFLGSEQLGYYTLSIILLSLLMLLPVTISQQMFPRMAQTFGQTKNILALRPFLIKQIVMTTFMLLPLLFGLYWLLPWIVESFIPEYTPGIDAAKIIIIGLSFLSISSGFVNFLNSVNKQMYFLIIQASALAVNVILDILFIKMGKGIEGVATGATITYIIYSTALSVTAYFVMHSEPDQKTMRVNNDT